MQISFIHRKRKSHRSIASENNAHEIMHPARDWGIVLGTAVCILIMGVVYTMYDFYTQFEYSSATPVVDSTVITYRDAEVTAYAKKYAEQEELFNILRGNVPDANSTAMQGDTSATIEGQTLAEEGSPEYTTTGAALLSP